MIPIVNLAQSFRRWDRAGRAVAEIRSTLKNLWLLAAEFLAFCIEKRRGGGKRNPIKSVLQ